MLRGPTIAAKDDAQTSSLGCALEWRRLRYFIAQAMKTVLTRYGISETKDLVHRHAGDRAQGTWTPKGAGPKKAERSREVR